MKRCPLCYRQPSVYFDQVGCVGLWEIGCNEHFDRIARQPTLDMATEQWNSVVDEVMPAARAA